METKPGWKSTEFYLSLAAMLLGALMASGLLTEGSTTERVVMLGLSVLAALGYTAARALTKGTAIKADAMLAASEAVNRHSAPGGAPANPTGPG
mgnify:CR=1 FL=1